MHYFATTAAMSESAADRGSFVHGKIWEPPGFHLEDFEVGINVSSLTGKS
jgi:hypothetical protein